jgi:hypothetical protein
MFAFTTEGKEKVDEEIESKEIRREETQSNNEVTKIEIMLKKEGKKKRKVRTRERGKWVK